MSAPASLEVRAVRADAFEEIYPLLLDFKNSRMGKDDWRKMLFAYAWSDEPNRGFALFDGGRPVGFMGTIFSSRMLAGRLERFCNTSAWIVREAYRNASILLLKPVLALRDHTILQLTPNATSYQIFRKLGFAELENEQLLLPPFPAGIGGLSALGGSFATAPATLERELSGDELALYRDLVDCRASHVLLRRGARRCYVVATPSHRKGLVFADIQYIGDRAFFWENRLLAHAAFLRSMGASALAVDGRFGEGYVTGPVARRAAKRLFRPSRPEIGPLAIDGLYSEWMYLSQ